MSAVEIVYQAPADDSEVVYFCGVRFFNDQPVLIDPSESAEKAHIVAKAKTNPHFVVLENAPEPAPKKGKG